METVSVLTISAKIKQNLFLWKDQVPLITGKKLLKTQLLAIRNLWPLTIVLKVWERWHYSSRSLVIVNRGCCSRKVCLELAWWISSSSMSSRSISSSWRPLRVWTLIKITIIRQIATITWPSKDLNKSYYSDKCHQM